MSHYFNISFILSLVLFGLGFGISKNENNQIQSDNSSGYKIRLSEPTIIIVQLDSIEIEELKNDLGDDIFYTGADDLMWYNSMLLKKNGFIKYSC